MSESDSRKQVSAALVKAQRQWSAAIKTKTAAVRGDKASYTYDYSDLASVIEAVKDPLNSEGIALMQTVSRCEDGVTATTTLLHESGESLVSTGTTIPLSRTATPQAVGSAITYAKRYDLQAFVGLPSKDDGGAAAEDESRQGNAAAQAVTPEQAKDALESLAAVSSEGVPAVQRQIEELERARPGVMDYIRLRMRPEFASIKKAALDARANAEARGREQHVLADGGSA